MYSPHLTGPAGSKVDRPLTPSLFEDMAALVRSKNYPCVPAILSFESGAFLVGEYDEFGTGKNAAALYQDLTYFSHQQKRLNSPYFTFWAVFNESRALSESQFEEFLWSELSKLSSAEPRDVPWDPKFSKNPEDDNFCLSLGGEALFVVGMHSQSSRLARRFKYPALLFNLYQQFDDLAQNGKYESTVRTNRAREMKYAGSINPMVAAYGDTREAIQFSGQQNPANWKCPFHRG